MTETGLSLGTPHYMSPEQAMGEREITGRSDVYALGCVLYEMLTGDPPFTGSTAQAIVAQVVTESPRPMIPRRHTIPAHIEAAVLRALEKLPADRFVTPAEFAHALAAAPAQVTRVSAAAAPTRRSPAVPWTPVLALALLLAAGLAWYFGRPRSEAKALVASLLPPPGCDFDLVNASNVVQLSPDGGRLAFVAVCGEDRSIWVRAMDTGENRELGGTAGAIYPFWSADGRSLGFFAAERLKRIEVEGGAIRDLAPAPDGRGGSWSADGTILYAPDVFGVMYRIPAEGGTPEAATQLPQTSQGISQRLPHFLPDGKHFLFAQGASTGAEGQLMAGTLGSLESRQVLDRTSNVTFADGYLFSVLDEVLLAQRFDPGELRFSGKAVAVASGLETWAFRFLGNYSYSAGRLVYREAVLPEARIEWFDPGSGARTAVLERGAYSAMRLSPDGRRLLVGRPDGRTSREHTWLYDLAEGGWSRLTRKSEVQYNFAWMPDGRQVVLQPEQRRQRAIRVGGRRRGRDGREGPHRQPDPGLGARRAFRDRPATGPGDRVRPGALERGAGQPAQRGALRHTGRRAESASLARRSVRGVLLEPERPPGDLPRAAARCDRRAAGLTRGGQRGSRGTCLEPQEAGALFRWPRGRAAVGSCGHRAGAAARETERGAGSTGQHQRDRSGARRAAAAAVQRPVNRCAAYPGGELDGTSWSPLNCHRSPRLRSA